MLSLFRADSIFKTVADTKFEVRQARRYADRIASHQPSKILQVLSKLNVAVLFDNFIILYQKEDSCQPELIVLYTIEELNTKASFSSECVVGAPWKHRNIYLALFEAIDLASSSLSAEGIIYARQD